MLKFFLLAFLTTFSINNLSAQSFSDGRLSGNFQLESQYYNQDSIIGAGLVRERILSNGFFNLNYSIGDFDIRLRYESYQKPLLGIDPQYEGSGFPYLHINYRSEYGDFTAGNFYEQFGSGLILRTFQEPTLGIDNSIYGFRFKFRPIEGIQLTALIGKQRNFWAFGDGIVRGGDLDLQLNTLFGDFLGEGLFVDFGLSAVSKFQPDLSSTLKLPENVFAFAGRLAVTGDNFIFDAEYSHKENDPTSLNRFVYNKGNALKINTSYFDDGIGATLSMHRLDNMDMRSDRTALGQKLNLNFIAPITKQHTYRLATVFPYGTQVNGEIGLQADINYKFKKGTLLGGDYGSNFNINYSQVHELDTSYIDKFTYDSKFFGASPKIYFRDFNFEYSRKWTDDLKTTFTFLNQVYDRDVLENDRVPIAGKVHSNVIILENLWNINEQHAIRSEIQHAWSRQDSVIKNPDNISGNWAILLLEYTFSPRLYITVWDEYNYGNPFEDRQIHYINGSVAYVVENTRFQIGFGRQRAGILCVGGICREVPASNGVFMSMFSAF